MLQVTRTDRVRLIISTNHKIDRGLGPKPNNPAVAGKW
jgi:hypothetical protein